MWGWLFFLLSRFLAEVIGEGIKELVPAILVAATAGIIGETGMDEGHSRFVSFFLESDGDDCFLAQRVR